MIEVKGLAKVYDMGEVKVEALKGINLRIGAGEFVTVMGSSGSGKSTFMNIVGCLDRPTAGQYLLDGQDVSSLSKNERAHIRNRKIGFIFQNFNLLGRTPAVENVELPMVYAGVGARQRRERAMEALRLVGLEGRENHFSTQLSGGQQQRVAIARALVNDPPILLADEPTGNLDSVTSHEIMDFLRGLNRDKGLTILMVTHESDIAAYGKRTIHFKDGLILEDLTT